MMITDEILLDLIDGRLPKEKADQIRVEISKDPLLRRRYEQLDVLDRVLAEQPLRSPSASFSKQVMANLSKRMASKPTMLWSKGLLIAIVVIGIGLVSAVVLLSNFPVSDIIPTDVQQITFKQNTLTFDPGAFINQQLFFKGLIYLNGFLGLFLFERAILRPFFKNRRQQFAV